MYKYIEAEKRGESFFDAVPERYKPCTPNSLLVQFFSDPSSYKYYLIGPPHSMNFHQASQRSRTSLSIVYTDDVGVVYAPLEAKHSVCLTWDFGAIEIKKICMYS